MRDLIACRMVFFLLAFYVGNWTIRIPDIKNQVNTDYAGIGLNGMAFALGAVLMMITMYLQTHWYTKSLT